MALWISDCHVTNHPQVSNLTLHPFILALKSVVSSLVLI